MVSRLGGEMLGAKNSEGMIRRKVAPKATSRGCAAGAIKLCRIMQIHIYIYIYMMCQCLRLVICFYTWEGKIPPPIISIEMSKLSPILSSARADRVPIFIYRDTAVFVTSICSWVGNLAIEIIQGSRTKCLSVRRPEAMIWSSICSQVY
jgi:hypothetical protein